jgi:hypothetical protein
MSKHTPGPWIVDEEKASVWRVADSSHSRNEICEVDRHSYYSPVKDEEARANLDLILAAPDLLSALESVCEECRHNPKVYGSEGKCLKGDPCEIDQAIKKARNE